MAEDMSDVDAPTSSDDVTAAWTEAALAATLDGVRVSEIDVEPITDNVGLAGQVIRILPSYDAAPDDAPASLILKLPTTDDMIFGFAEGMGMYEREARFYDDIAPHVEIDVPRARFSLCDPAEHRYCLLLDEVDVGSTVSQATGATPDQARDIIATIAAFHATWHRSPLLEQWDWLPRPSGPTNKSLSPRFEGSWPIFMDNYAALVPDRTIGWVEAFVPKMDAWFDSKDDDVHTVAHGDLRLDNMVWDTSGRMVLLDWQLVQASYGMYDVAYFLATNMAVENRRAHEDELLELWRTTMVEAGADPGTAEHVRRLYRETVMFWSAGVVCAAADFGGSDEGRALLELLITRSFTAADDLTCGDVIP